MKYNISPRKWIRHFRLAVAFCRRRDRMRARACARSMCATLRRERELFDG